MERLNEMYTFNLNFDQLIYVKHALSTQRNIFIKDWLSCHNLGFTDLETYWANRIQNMNSAGEALSEALSKRAV